MISLSVLRKRNKFCSDRAKGMFPVNFCPANLFKNVYQGYPLEERYIRSEKIFGTIFIIYKRKVMNKLCFAI